jgi:hypothetical protein
MENNNNNNKSKLNIFTFFFEELAKRYPKWK